uniref:TctD transcriptional regulator n=1 Tax=Melanthalia intermedia TaxID=172989 RepID=A0A345UAZ6_9FLOR|nr:hypothetical protein [Melanthalia intermedia]AXI97632.1 hypothetical protein [Melanthalia intermedia]
MKKKLLIIDDDSFLTKSISSYLISEDFLVDAANNSSNIMHHIEVTKPDLIITDIMMPHLDGYDLMKKIRKSKISNTIPVIFLTAKGMTSDRIVGYNLGCNAYIAKPFFPKELLAIIKNIFKNLESISISRKANEKNLTSLSANKQSEKIVLSNLTSREYNIIILVSKGFMNKEIAHKLNISLRNVEKYVSQLLQKTDTRNRTELAKLALFADLKKKRANDGNRTRE